jgi:hypothetical protein
MGEMGEMGERGEKIERDWEDWEDWERLSGGETRKGGTRKNYYRNYSRQFVPMGQILNLGNPLCNNSCFE